MGEIVRLQKGQKFTKREAERILPAIKRVTNRAVEEWEELEAKIAFARPHEGSRAALQERLEEIQKNWIEKIEQMGLIPKGIWGVDIDNGEGFFCWRYGEEKLAFQHRYEDDFNSRRPIL